jgi:hypothetical protein
MSETSQTFERCLDAVRGDTSARSPLQRLCCDLRSLDRHVDIYHRFAKDVDWTVQSTSLDLMLGTLWWSGDPSTLSEAQIRGIIPDPERVGGSYAATAQMIGAQLLETTRAGISGQLDDAMSAVELSYETVYMYVRETDMLNSPRGILIEYPSSPKFAEDTQRWLAEVRKEAACRQSDLRDPRVAGLTNRPAGAAPSGITQCSKSRGQDGATNKEWRVGRAA